MGPNGAGKTTTLRMLSCLISQTDGTASVSGFDIKSNPTDVRRSIGVLTENPSIYERLTAVENMEFFAQAYGMSDKAERTRRIDELLEFFKLSERKNDKVSTFSKGMKPNLAIAKSIVNPPQILLLDEPTANLDPEASREIRDLIMKLSQQEKCTTLICTHHLEDAEKICNRVMIMNRGKVLIVGTPGELRDRIGEQPTLRIALKGANFGVLEALKNANIVNGLEVDGDVMTMKVSNLQADTPLVVKSIVDAGGEVLSVNVVRPSLEDAYLKLVKS